MNTRNVFTHYIPVPQNCLLPGTPFTFEALVDIVAVGALQNGQIGPLLTYGGNHYNPAWLSAPDANFRYMEPGEKSGDIQPGSGEPFALIVLTDGEFAPVVKFTSAFVAPPSVQSAALIGWAPADFDVHRRVASVVFTDGTSGNYAYDSANELPAHGVYKAQMTAQGYRVYTGQVYTTDPS